MYDPNVTLSRADMPGSRGHMAARTPQDLDRNLALDLVRVTEAAAMAAGRWVGRGDKDGGDGAAVDAMRKLINSMPMRGIVVIGEGEKDNAPMLFNGEQVGDGTGPEVDVAVDPIDGTTLMSKGMPNALAVLAVAERGAMFDPSAVFYMEKLAVGPDCADVIDINAGVDGEPAPHRQGQALQRLRRDRLHPRPAAARRRWSRRSATRAPASSSSPTATSPARSARPASESDVDVLMGIGGTPEGITAACALKCLGGMIQAKLWPRDDAEREKALAAGHDLDRVLHHRRPGHRRQLLLRRHRRHLRRPAARACGTGPAARYTQSIVMRSKSGTIRVIDSYHRLEKLALYSLVDFDVSRTEDRDVEPSARPGRRCRAGRARRRRRWPCSQGSTASWATASTTGSRPPSSRSASACSCSLCACRCMPTGRRAAHLRDALRERHAAVVAVPRRGLRRASSSPPRA